MPNPNRRESLREEFQNFADSIVWQNDDGSEKYIAVGNMFDWWLAKIDQEVEDALEKNDNDWKFKFNSLLDLLPTEKLQDLNKALDLVLDNPSTHDQAK